MTSTADLIRIKRDGGRWDAPAINRLVAGITDETVEDAQLGAFLMAVYLQGLDTAEQAALTLAMRDSGSVMDWPDLHGPVLDKHSTGGVGDLVSLILGPLIAACGGYVPMISGRGLGHTGGTLDKMESIPGLTVGLGRDRFRDVVHTAGFAMAGQGPDLAPADRRMYATRDITATVSCLPLIISSILSKKLSEGLDALVMDIKTGNGAIISDPAASLRLAEGICAVAQEAGLPCTALVTDMNYPLADSAGNALEMAEAVNFLSGESANERLAEVVFSLCGELLLSGGIENDAVQAGALLQARLNDGSAAECFAVMCAMQGGPKDFIERPERYLATAPVQFPVEALQSGYIVNVDTREFGRIVNSLGGGRQRASDEIDHSVGLTAIRSPGEFAQVGDPLLTVHARTMDEARSAGARLLDAITLHDERPQKPESVIKQRVQV